MKKKFLTGLLLSALVLSSCSNDDDVVIDDPVVGVEDPVTPEDPEMVSVVLNEIRFGAEDRVEIFNNGNINADLSNYWLCLGPGTYVQLGTLTPDSGSVSDLAPGDFLVLPYSMPDDEGGLGLYSSDAFASAEAIVDFVQYGAAGSAREDVAVEAGIWTSGDFVPATRLNSFSIEFDGEGDASTDWSEEVNPSLGLANNSEVATSIFNITINNVTNYLNVHTFTERLRAGDAPTRGPLNMNGDQYQISFQAVPGTRFSPVTMMGNSNDWFLAPTDLNGIDLFPGGAALNNVDVASLLSLYDLGTEADNDPATFPPAGANVGPADENPLVRLVPGRVTGDIYITAVLTYEASSDPMAAGTFTFTITTINAPDPAEAASSTNGFVPTPGIAVLHALANPLFDLGTEDRGVGLEAIAEDGNPDELFAWFTETGSNGSPLRLSSSLSVFSPGLVYAFNTERDPLVLQGETNNPANGLEELAEDGNNSIAVDYVRSLGLPVAASDQTMNIGPGEELTFTLEVPQGQGYKFGFGTMFVQTNDWFIAYNNEGYPLFDENGAPVSGTGASAKSYLYDAGTEIDEAVGFGIYQAPRQNGPNEGPEDENTTVRRVGNLEDVQFGKGVYSNGPGVVYLRDPRGGYNVISINIEVQ
ncbi:spondin domain-containing protein [Spongiimicrobium salis]|uniref:spondin domain-containing protein n=1 Tax=Spongiimicrobium salis TaxID=1667022 RepID=UPI00374C8CF0